MADGATTSFQQDDEQKRRWKEAVEENGKYQSLSHLIRLSVEKELSGGRDGGGGSVPEDFARQVQQLSETVEGVNQKLNQLHERVGDVERHLTQESPAVQELASEVFQVLPTRGEIISETHESVVEAGEPSEVGTVSTGRIDHIATRLGVDEVDVGEALQKLTEDTAQVHSTTIDGHTRYYKEE